MIVKTGTLNDTDASGTDTAGDKISYTLTVTNEGTVTLNTVVVTDPDADASPARVADTNGNGDAFLEIGETWNYTAVHTLTQAEIDAGTFTNTADVDAVDPETTPVNDDDTDTQTFTQGGDIDLVEVGTFQDDDGDGFAQPGEEVIFTYTVTNTGNVTLTGVTVNEKAPIDGGLTGNTVTGGPIGSLAPDDDDTTTFTATYVLTQADIDAGEVISVGIATGTLPDGNTTVQDDSSAPAVVIIPRNPDFEIAVDVDLDLIKATLLTDLDTGDFIEVVEQSAVELVYSIEVPNTGNVSLFDPALTFIVTQNTSTGTVTIPLISGPTYQSGDDNLDGVFDVTESWTYTATAAVTEPMVGFGRGSITGTGTFDAVSGIGSEVRLDEKSDDALTGLQISLTSPESSDPNDLDIAKATLSTTVRQGDVMPWTITVTNNASAGEEVVSVTDTLPSGFIFQQGTATVNGLSVDPLHNGSVITFPAVQVAAGTTTTIVINTLISGSLQPGQYVNRVRFVDDEGNSEEATASIVVGAEPVFDCGVVIGKVFDDRNQNGYQDPMPVRSAAVTNQDIFGGKFGGKLSTPQAPQGEPGIPGVRVVTVNGELITTDAHGR